MVRVNKAYRDRQHPSALRSVNGQPIHGTTGLKLKQFHIDPLLDQCICNALWPKSKPIVRPTVYPLNPPISKLWLLNIGLENPRSRSWVRSKFKVTTGVQHPIDSHHFCSMSTHPVIPMIELFLKNLTFKSQGQNHIQRSHSRYTILSNHIYFVPCWMALSFLRYSSFKNWLWRSKVKAIGEVKVQSHDVSLTSYQPTSVCFHINRPSHSWDSAFSKFYLEKPRSRS